jgi:hypothetical protein
MRPSYDMRGSRTEKNKLQDMGGRTDKERLTGGPYIVWRVIKLGIIVAELLM